MVNEPPFHCQGDPARRGNMELTRHFPSLLAAQKAVPPEFAFARASVVPTLRTEAAHQWLHSGCPRPAGSRPPGRSTRVRAALASAPPSLPKSRNSPPDPPAGCARRGVRPQLRASSDLRAAAFPPLGGGSGGAAAVTRRPRGGKNCARRPPLPPRRCLRWEQRRQSRVGRPGLRSFHPPTPRPSGRPPPARRPDQAGSSRENGVRGPSHPGPRIPVPRDRSL
ncbi:wiskott-Aldrich syndrome protein homolog 1-like [Mastomys coucha]|uniref:wiskott-Aldrich syndrome protein homolog 1-like n=1 Tax=Mastomys coucha TaxID=35658 RepID=UPI00126153BC|nr:wiskott-Aldrich syndrome protein homolog 1-like [Mastomys coucha]